VMQEYCLVLTCPAPTLDIPRRVRLVPGCGSTVKFGRDTSKVNVWLDSKKVPNMISRLHAFCEWKPPNSWQIRDNGSVNGIFVNDVKVLQQTLRVDDVITFGGGAKLGLGQSLSQPYSEFTYKYVEDNSSLKRSNSQNVPSATPMLLENSPSKYKRKAEELELEHQEKEKKLRQEREELEKERKAYAEKAANLAAAEKRNKEEQEKICQEQEERRRKQLEIDREKNDEVKRLHADYEQKLREKEEKALQLAREQEAWLGSFHRFRWISI